MLGGGASGAAGGGSPMVFLASACLGPLLAGAMGAGGSGGGGLGGMLGGLLGGGGGAAASSDPIAGFFVDMALGDGNSAIAKYIDDALGFKITPILAMAAPFVLGLLKKNTVDRGLTPAALAAEITQGNDEFIAKGGPTAQLLTEAKDAAKQALALKAKFSPELWEKVTRCPWLRLPLWCRVPVRWSQLARIKRRHWCDLRSCWRCLTHLALHHGILGQYECRFL